MKSRNSLRTEQNALGQANIKGKPSQKLYIHRYWRFVEHNDKSK